MILLKDVTTVLRDILKTNQVQASPAEPTTTKIMKNVNGIKMKIHPLTASLRKADQLI